MTAGDPNLSDLVEVFSRLEGRQPRVMVSCEAPPKFPERVNSVSLNLADHGFDVDVGPFFIHPGDLSLHAVENDVDLLVVLDMDSHSNSEFRDQLLEELVNKDRSDLQVLYAKAEVSSQALISALESLLED